MTMKAPAGPPICTFEPPSAEIRKPATMAVIRALLWLEARGDRKGHRQRQGDDADRDAGADVGQRAVAVVAAQRVNQARTNGSTDRERTAGTRQRVQDRRRRRPQWWRRVMKRLRRDDGQARGAR